MRHRSARTWVRAPRAGARQPAPDRRGVRPGPPGVRCRRAPFASLLRMAIRHATADDVADLLPLFRAYCDFYESNPPDAGLEEMIRATIDLPNDEAFLLVAEDGDEVLGFAACCWKWSSLRGARIVFLDDLYVRQGSRGEGHADS